MFTPCRITTRPLASVIQRPEWPRGVVGPAPAAAQKTVSQRVAARASPIPLRRPDTPGSMPLRRGRRSQRLGEDRDVGGLRLRLGLAAGVGDAGKDAAAVEVAQLATHVAVVLEPLDQ